MGNAIEPHIGLFSRMASIKYLPPAHASLDKVQWLCGNGTNLEDVNLVLFIEMNHPVCFKNSLPGVYRLHKRWNAKDGEEKDRIKKSFKVFVVSTAFGDWHVNNMRRTKEWLDTGDTKGEVSGEYGSRLKHFEHLKDLPLGMDTMERRTRNRAKLKVMAAKMLEEQPWHHDPHVPKEQTLTSLTNYLSGRPFYGVAAEANDFTQHSPAFLLFNKEREVLWRHTGNVSDVHVRDLVLEYVMGVKSKPLITEEFRQACLAEYRAAKKYAPGAHRGEAIIHHDGVNLDAPKEEPKDEEEKKE